VNRLKSDTDSKKRQGTFYNHTENKVELWQDGVKVSSRNVEWFGKNPFTSLQFLNEQIGLYKTYRSG
jgi:hypothetical protein